VALVEIKKARLHLLLLLMAELLLLPLLAKLDC
jgi:hypothetical protein